MVVSVVPLRAVIMEGLTFVAVTFVVIMLYIRYYQRRKGAAFSLALAFTFWDLGALSVFIAALVQFIKQPASGGASFNYATIGINFGYAFSALSNIFIVLFVSQIFYQAPFFRRTQKLLPIINSILNGITIGMVIDTLSTNWLAPEYPIPQTVYHLVLTIFSFSLLLSFTIKPLQEATFRWEKVGFGLIISSAVSGILIYLSFALDIIFPDIFGIFIGGYSPFNTLGWVFGILMCVLAYYGYVMPKFLRNMFREQVT